MGAAMLGPKAEGKTRGYGAEPASARAQEIARRHEEMLGLLRDLPECDYELSFTDLVERTPAVDGEGVPAAADMAVAGEAPSAGHAADKVKERRVRASGGGGGNGEGVLLNVYVPSSLTRSLTGSRLRAAGPSKRAQADCNKRDKQHLALGCWSAIWKRGGTGKARRQ